MSASVKVINTNSNLSRETIKILGVDIDVLTHARALDKLKSFLDKDENHLIVTPNPEMIMLARREPRYKEILQSAALSVPDGIGVVLASKLTDNPVSERVPGCDLIMDLLKELAATKHTVYFLGAAPGVAEKAKRNVECQFPGIKIIGAHNGYFDDHEDRIISEELSKLKPDVLLVGLSMGMAEKWAFKHMYLPVKITCCVGGTLDILGGNVKRAPEGFRKLGLEWFYRLLKQPKRALRMTRLPVFALLVLADRFKQFSKR
jgi:N-acetylglucosaminyldiphosphoundecaprenol N-acetyl-beta-D-mannosaminyltransferase